MKCDCLILGGSLGGVSAALSLLNEGLEVIITESTNWIGGQITTQGVPLDEHKYIEECGCTLSYRKFRNDLRNYYYKLPNFKEELKTPNLNPGGGWVSGLCVEPKVALNVLLDYLNPFILNGKLKILYNTEVIKANKKIEKIVSVTVTNNITNENTEITANYFIDATDNGDLLPIADIPYRIGSESKEEFNELHATIADKEDLQPITYVCAIGYFKDKSYEMEKPKLYDYYKNYYLDETNNPLLSWITVSLNDKGYVKRKLLGDWMEEGEVVTPLFTYRQIYDPNKYNDNLKYDGPITLLNWPQNDYFFNNIIETNQDKLHIEEAKELTKSLVYWLKTEAKRHDNNGYGYPEINLVTDIFDTKDGFAPAPYIREGRRLKALYTIKEQDISKKLNKTPKHFFDSCGIGHYNIDVHYTTKSHSFFFDETWPFEIPLGSLIPIKCENYFPASKNIGTTHITNGCFRLHPVEWNIGEVSGYLVSFLNKKNITPQNMYNDIDMVKEFQEYIKEKGVNLSWPLEVFK